MDVIQDIIKLFYFAKKKKKKLVYNKCKHF